jgi:hypothetical protein
VRWGKLEVIGRLLFPTGRKDVLALVFDLTLDADDLTCSVSTLFREPLSARGRRRGLLTGILTSAVEIPCRKSIPE